MANGKNIIDEFISPEAESQLGRITQAIGDIASSIDVLNKKTVNLEINLKGAKNLEELVGLTEKIKTLNREALKLAKAQADIAKIESSTNLNKVKAEELELRKKIAKQKEADRQRDRTLAAEKKQQVEAERQAERQRAEEEKRANAERLERERKVISMRKEWGKAAKEAQRAIAQADREAAQAAKKRQADELKKQKEREREIQLTLQSNNAYLQLVKQYEQARLKALALAAAHGSTNAQVIKQIELMNSLRQRLDGVHKTVGLTRREQLGYNAVTMQFNQLLRETPNAAISMQTFVISLSNNMGYFIEAVSNARKSGQSFRTILGSLGRSLFGVVGIASLVVVAITALGRAWSKAREEADKFKKAIDQINESSKENEAQMRARAKVLRDIAEDERRPMDVRMAAAKEMLETYPSVFKGLKEEALLAGKVGDAYMRLADFISRSAEVRGEFAKMTPAFKELGDAEYEIAKLEEKKKKLEADLEDFMVRQSRARSFGADQVGGVVDPSAVIEMRISRTQKNINKLKDDAALAQKIIDDAMDIIQKNIDVTPLDLSGPKDKKDKTKRDDFARLLRELNADVWAEMNKGSRQMLENELETDKELLSNKELSAREQIEIRQRIHDNEMRLINLEALAQWKELEDSKVRERERIKNLKITQKEREQMLKSLEQLEAHTFANIAMQRNHEAMRSRRSLAKDEMDIIAKAGEDEVKYILSNLKRIEVANINAFQARRDALDKALAEGNITRRKYIRQARELERQTLATQLQDQIDYLKESLELTQADAKEKEKIFNQIALLQDKLNKANTKNVKEGFREWAKELLDVQKALQGVGELLSAMNERERRISEERIRRIQHERDEADFRYQNEINKIRLLPIAEQEKNKRIAELSAEQYAFNAELRRREVEERRRQMEFEKQAAIAQATIDGIAAVIKVIDKPYLAAAIGAISAAKIAQMAATPIPQYYKGTLSSPEGLAWVGEKGPELKIGPKGDVSLTPGRPTLDYLEKGTQIIPADKTKQILSMAPQFSTMSHTGGYYIGDKSTDRITSTLNRNARDVVNAVKGIKPRPQKARREVTFSHIYTEYYRTNFKN